MTVTEVLLNFRRALNSLAPTFDSVQLPWRAPDAYDEWDDVATALYRALVVEVLRYSLPESAQEAFRLSAYDMRIEDYSEHSTLEVIHPAFGHERHVFHSFATRTSPHDVILSRRVSERGTTLDSDLIDVPVEGAEFVLVHATGRVRKTIREILLPN